MRCHVTNGSRPITQATAHSLRTHAWAATRLFARQRQSAVGLHLRNPSLMDYYSFNRPRRNGRLSRPCWLTDSGRLTHKEVTRPAVSLAQDRESHSYSIQRTIGSFSAISDFLIIIIIWLFGLKLTSILAFCDIATTCSYCCSVASPGFSARRSTKPREII